MKLILPVHQNHFKLSISSLIFTDNYKNNYNYKKNDLSLALWWTLVIPALGKGSRKTASFEYSLSYTVRLYLKKTKKKKRILCF
jgi:hypothetical protein